LRRETSGCECEEHGGDASREQPQRLRQGDGRGAASSEQPARHVHRPAATTWARRWGGRGLATHVAVEADLHELSLEVGVAHVQQHGALRLCGASRLASSTHIVLELLRGAAPAHQTRRPNLRRHGASGRDGHARTGYTDACRLAFGHPAPSVRVAAPQAAEAPESTPRRRWAGAGFHRNQPRPPACPSGTGFAHESSSVRPPARGTIQKQCPCKRGGNAHVNVRARHERVHLRLRHGEEPLMLRSADGENAALRRSCFTGHGVVETASVPGSRKVPYRESPPWGAGRHCRRVGEAPANRSEDEVCGAA
jgi:hypothetical protein